MLASTRPRHRLPSLHTLRALLCALLIAASLCALGCAAVDDDPTAGADQEASFALSPTITVRASRPDIQLDRLFIGVGNIFLEPIDAPGASLISAANSLPLTFTLDETGTATLRLPEVPIAHAGRYLVSIAVEPLLVPDLADWPSPILESAPKDGFSIMIQGLLMHELSQPSSDGDTRKDEPEPLPWRLKGLPDILSSDLSPDPAPSVECIPFEYQSDRTGFMRLGEVKLSAERSELIINIDLGYWIDAAVVPIIEDINAQTVPSPPGDKPSSSDEHADGDLVDLSDYNSLQGLGIEHVLGTTRAEAR
jgi:hypothetical protein